MSDIELTSAELDELERLAKAATPGPWDVWAEPTKSKDEAIDELAYQVMNTPDEDFAEAVHLLNANGKCPATTGCGPTSKANAAFLAAARNNFARLLSLARAGLEARKAEESMRERAALACEAQKQGFLSPQYASNQPLGSILERFACDECATAIRELPLTGGEK